MTSISEDPTLPLDLDGTSNQLSNFSGGARLDSSSADVTSSISSELEQPGTFPNLTSAGRISPHRTRTMKDQESQLAELKKENFGLKLRIYHLEEALRTRWGDDSDGWKLNIELQVQLDNQQKELAEKDALLMQAKSAIDHMAEEHDAHIREMQHRVSQTTQTEQMEERLADREAELADALREVEDTSERVGELQAQNDRLEYELQDKDENVDRLEREVEGLKHALAESDAAAKAAPPPRGPSYSVGIQTTEPLAAKLDDVEAELEAAQAELKDKDRVVVELETSVRFKDKKIHELELEVLLSSQKLAAEASQHAQQMQEQAEQMDRCKANLRDVEDQLKRQGAEFEERGRQLDEARRRMRDAEALAEQLQPQVQEKDWEIEDLRRQLRDADAQAKDDKQAKDREIQDLKRRLKNAESLSEQSQPELAARNREIEELSEVLREKDEELSRLRSQLREKEEALSRARKSTHTSNVEKQEQTAALQRLQEEMEALREMLRQQNTGAQHDLEAALAAKDAINAQLRRDLQDLQSKLDDADEKILELTTSKAAELGVLRSSLEDLTRQLEHQENLVRALKNEIGQLTGEKASLEREVEKLRDDNQHLLQQVESLHNELAARAKALQEAEQAIARLQKIIEDLQKSQPQQSELESNAATLAQLRSQLAALEHSLRNKESEVESLLQTIKLKDKTIRDLQQQLQRLMNDKARLEERVRDLEAEKTELEGEVASLQSQMRISKLSSEDLQNKLTQVYGEREELARKLKIAEEQLNEKGTAHDQASAACEALQKQIKELERQVAELTRQARKEKAAPKQDEGVSMSFTRHETSTSTNGAQPQQPGSSSTTMIFGSLSENLLLTILQRLQELFAEMTASRAEGNMASSSMSSKLEHITDLQRHLESIMQEAPPPSENRPSPSNTSYTAYYYMGGEEGEGSPKRSSTPRSKGASPWQTPQKPPETSTPMRDAMRRIGALQSELEEVKRWNEALRARLDETGRTRNVGVGMEKDGDSHVQSAPQVTEAGFAPERYLELEREVDRLLSELEGERERSQLEKEQQQSEFATLQGRLEEAEEKVTDLQRQLRLAMRADAATSTDDITVGMLQEEVERLTQELENAKGVIASLRGKVEAESDDNQRLREELAEVQFTSPKMTQDKSTLAASSMPNLLTPDRSQTKLLSDSWTSPGTALAGEHLDVRALRQRHEEVTRLNQELQRKCQEKLKRSPPQSRPSSSGQSTLHWQAKMREQEQTLRSEMLERERTLLAQMRESEARFIERESELKTRETTLRRQVADLEARLGGSERSNEHLKSKLAEALAASRSNDEEIENLSRSLKLAQEKIEALEEQIDHLLSEKNATIHDLETKIHSLERGLQLSHERVERLTHTVEVLGSGRGEGEGESMMEGEVKSLQETVDLLTQQLTDALEELDETKRLNLSLEEHHTVLNSQLASCQEQIRTLQNELTLYQKLLQDAVKGEKGSQSFSLTAEKVLQLLEEVRHLREQLDQSITSNSALASQLRSRLEQQQHDASHQSSSTTSETHVHISRPSPPSARTAASTQTQTDRRTPRYTTDRGTTTSRIPMSEKSTGTHMPTTSDQGTSPLRAKTSSSSFKSKRTSSEYRHRKTHTDGASPTAATLSFTDMNQSDSSTSSFARQHPPPPSSTSKPTSRFAETLSTSTTNFTFTSPKDTSSPHLGASTTRSSTKPPFSSASEIKLETHKRQFSDGIPTERVTRVTHHSRGVNTDLPLPPRSHSDEFLSAKGPSLDTSSSSSFYSRTSNTRHQEGDATRGWRRPGSGGASYRTTTSFASTSRPPPFSTLLHGAGDFESLEMKLKQALDSPTLQGADRVFLEELLMYLRQQRMQLDESRRLLERLEQQSAGVPPASHVGVETAESGTMPAGVHVYNGVSTGTQASGGGAEARGAKVDLSSLYEQMLRTHASLVETKSSLNSQRTS